MNLYLIRHGQSEANLKGIIQGHADFPLSGPGKKQATLVGEFFSSLTLDAIYSSDLSRAYETAVAVEDHQPKRRTVSPMTLLREVGLGPLEGLTRKEMRERFPELKRDSLLTSGIDGTETLESITNRCAELKKFLKGNHPNDTIAAVSHGGFISIFLTYLMAEEDWPTLNRPFIIGNTGVTRVEFQEMGKPKFHYINRMSHLEKEESMRTSAILY